MGSYLFQRFMFLVRLPIFEKDCLLILLRRVYFPIYLMNTIVIGTLKGVAFKFLIWDYNQFKF